MPLTGSGAPWPAVEEERASADRHVELEPGETLLEIAARRVLVEQHPHVLFGEAERALCQAREAHRVRPSAGRRRNVAILFDTDDQREGVRLRRSDHVLGGDGRRVGSDGDGGGGSSAERRAGSSGLPRIRRE